MFCRHFDKEIVVRLNSLSILSKMGATLLKNRMPVVEGAIGMLNMDTLLVIFNFLSLYEKLIAMRVRKEWHLIIKNYAWTVIDFRDKGPPRKVAESSRQFRRFVSQNGQNKFEYRECGNEWEFPMNENDVLKFLTLYAGIGLQEIHLSVASDEIVSYLRVNCPNINTLGICFKGICVKEKSKVKHFEWMRGKKKFNVKHHSVSNENLSQLLHFLPKLQRLHLTWPRFWSNDFYYEQIIKLLQKCNLRYVSLHEVDLLFLSKLKKISPATLTSLREVELCDKFRVQALETDDDILSSAVGGMTSLTCLKLTNERRRTPHGSFHRRYEIDGDRLFPSIAHWTHLKILTLQHVRYSTEAFEMMIQGLLNLETLVLEGISVKSSVVNLINIHLKKIKSLQLSPGLYQHISSKYSSESLQSLSYHPTVENLAVEQTYDERNQINWVERIYDILVTLPKIKKVKLTGYNLVSCFSQASYPSIECAEIEVILIRKVNLYRNLKHIIHVTSEILTSENILKY
ncbi:uncharacterized protein [Amphiura filiformis]|uniref:uncharacterized protein n=1 Tax=Amphiura filiformis TaxID=82378 RepID=UPI003B22579A